MFAEKFRIDEKAVAAFFEESGVNLDNLFFIRFGIEDVSEAAGRKQAFDFQKIAVNFGKRIKMLEDDEAVDKIQ